MNFYWASAGSFVFFMLIGVLGGSLLHLEGPRWYFFMGLMCALGLSSAALFYYFQRKAQERHSASGGAFQFQPTPARTKPTLSSATPTPAWPNPKPEPASPTSP